MKPVGCFPPRRVRRSTAVTLAKSCDHIKTMQVRTNSRPRETERFCEERAVEPVECEAMLAASAMANPRVACQTDRGGSGG